MLRQQSPFAGDLQDGIRVPEDSQRVLRRLKDRLVQTLERNLLEVLNAEAPAKALKDTFTREGYLWAEGDRWEEAALDGTISIVPDHEEFQVAELCILLAPGSDCVLVVFERAGEQWSRQLVVRNDDYATIEGAIHNLYWTISPSWAEGTFYLLEAHTHPWPSSRWRSFSYRALAPSSVPSAPRVLAQGKASGDWESGYDLNVTHSGFTVGFQVFSDQGPNFVRSVRHVWKWEGERFAQVQSD